MSGIFLSYRRADSRDIAQGIFESLEKRFRWVEIFKDIDSIPPGRDFVAAITRALERSTLVVAVIGPEWLTARDGSGRRRLDNPADFVRLEVETALQRRISLVVVLANGATLPDPGQLPPSLVPITQCPTYAVRDGPTFVADMDSAMAALSRLQPALARWRPTYPRVATVAAVDLVVVYSARIAIQFGQNGRSSALASVGELVGFLGTITAIFIIVYMAFRLVQLGRWVWFIALLAVGAFSFGLILLVFGLIAPNRPVRPGVGVSKN